MDKQSRSTAQKPNMAESKYEVFSKQEPNNENCTRLDEIEADISKIGEELKELHYKMTAETDKYSEDYLAMQEDRTMLKKQLLELDLEHKMIIANRVRECKKLEESRRE